MQCDSQQYLDEVPGPRCRFKQHHEGPHSFDKKGRADARAIWAVAVLDAQAKRYESSTLTPAYVGVTSKVDGSRLGFWRISVNGIRALQADCQGMFPTADAARLAAATALYPDLPESVRRELGECP